MVIYNYAESFPRAINVRTVHDNIPGHEDLVRTVYLGGHTRVQVTRSGG